MIHLGDFSYKNDDDIINTFKEVLKPKYGGKKSSKFSDYIVSDFEEYLVIMPWLKKNDYFIEEFPNAIQNQVSLKTLGYDMIRSKILKDSGQSAGSVSWEDRRLLIDSLTIKKRNDFPVFKLEIGIKEIIREVSIGKGELHNLELDEQLALLNNTIEYLLKAEGGYRPLSNDTFYGFIGEKEVKKFRSDTQIFRHGSRQAIFERKSWTDNKKKFYARLGIMIITNIYKNI